MNNGTLKEVKLNNKSSIINLIIILSLFGNFFNTGGKSISAIIGVVSYLLTALLILLLMSKNIEKVSYKTLLFIWCFMNILIFLIFNKGENAKRVIITLSQLIFIVGIVSSGINFEIDEKLLTKYKKLNIFFIIVLYICTILRFKNIPIMFKNLNALSEMSALFFILNVSIRYMSDKKLGINHAILYLPLLLLSDGRNMMLCVIVFYVVFNMWKIITKSFLNRILTFNVATFIIYFITVKYSEWYYESSMVDFNRWIRDITGKNFFSGRQIIWNQILEVMEGNEIIGYGTGTIYSNLFDSNLSAHNQYLQLYMQSGLVGLLILFTILFYIWMKLTKYNRENEDLYRRKRVSSSLLISFMITNIFTVSMLQNTLYSSLTAWFIISFGLKKGSNYNTGGNKSG